MEGPWKPRVFWGPVKWHRAVRRVPFGAQESRDQQKKPTLAKKESDISEKESDISKKEPDISKKEPDISKTEFSISKKGSGISNKYSEENPTLAKTNPTLPINVLFLQFTGKNLNFKIGFDVLLTYI